jgi:cystathionine beta-lyase/cystathionine gamma-synthase
VIEPRDDRADVFAKPETLLTHDDRFDHDPVVPPLYQSSLFTFSTFEEIAGIFAGQRKRPIYSRGDNPPFRNSRRKLQRSKARRRRAPFPRAWAQSAPRFWPS